MHTSPQPTHRSRDLRPHTDPPRACPQWALKPAPRAGPIGPGTKPRCVRHRTCTRSSDARRTQCVILNPVAVVPSGSSRPPCPPRVTGSARNHRPLPSSRNWWQLTHAARTRRSARRGLRGAWRGRRARRGEGGHDSVAPDGAVGAEESGEGRCALDEKVQGV